jgi:ubiquinone/menaquinone biosynthesis C-methylase UbiE
MKRGWINILEKKRIDLLLDKDKQCEVFNKVYGDLEKARRLYSSPIRMYYESRTLAFALQGLETSQLNCLDLGCGRGVFTNLLKDRFHYVIASDFAVEAVRTAKSLLQHNNLDFLVSDANYLPIKNAYFDMVIIKDFIHHLPEPATAMQEIHRILRRGGFLISIEPNNRNIIAQIMGRMMKHERQSVKNSPSFLIRFIQGYGFRLVHSEFDGFYVPYGPFYRLPSSMLPVLRGLEDGMRKLVPYGGGHFITCYQRS